MKKDELNTQTTEPREVKRKILSRIQEQLNRNEGEESVTYIRDEAHNKAIQYLKGPWPIEPDAE